MKTKISPQAENLNNTITRINPSVLELLSERGKAAYFPKSGILGQTAEARGKKINATIGVALSENGSPLHLKSISNLVKLEPKDVFLYAPSYGLPELRQKWLELMRNKNLSLKTEVSLPVVTNALTHGLSVCAALFVEPGDKIIVSDKFWGNYRLIFELNSGGSLSVFNTFINGGFDTSGLRKAISKGTGKKILLLNFPNNPSGYSPSQTEAEEIVEIVRDRAVNGDKIVVLLDDAYFGLVYENKIAKESLFSKIACVHKNVLAVKIDGASKEDYAWGLRVGFLTFGIKDGNKELYDSLEAKTAGIIRGQISNASHLSQSALLRALESKTYAKEKIENYRLLKSRYSEVKKCLKDKKYLSVFSALPFNSGYFMCLQLKNKLDSDEIRKILLSKYDTGVISLPDGLLRIAYSSVPTKLIPKLFENIFFACKEARSNMDTK